MRRKPKKTIGLRLWLIRKLLPKGSHVHGDPVRKEKSIEVVPECTITYKNPLEV